MPEPPHSTFLQGDFEHLGAGLLLVVALTHWQPQGRSLCVISDISEGKQIRVFPYFVSQHPQATSEVDRGRVLLSFHVMQLSLREVK